MFDSYHKMQQIGSESQRKQIMKEQSRVRVIDDIQYYRKSEKETHWVSRDTFDLRFPQIRDSLVTFGFWKTMYHILRWRFSYTNQGIPDNLERLQHELPVEKPVFDFPENKITYTWIGHSTAVISFGKDANFVIDPVFSERTSPFQWIGPKRIRPLPCNVQQLPKIDAVLVSHDHYDHLDQDALQRLYNRNKQCQFYAGLNSTDVFPTGCKMNEMDWTNTKELIINNKKFKITFVPVCHWSRRGAFDKNWRLWGGFVIQSPNGKKVFYSGDTGYCGIFKQLGKIFGGFDLSVLPIGAYIPREFLKNQHVDPEQAVKVHIEIKSKKSVGVHWGTFPLGYQHYTAARTDLKKAVEKYNLKQDDFITVNHGGSFSVDYL